MKKLTRRDFIKGAAAVTGVTVASGCGQKSSTVVKKTATDLVPLGQTGLKISRLGIGTGSHGGRIQRELGQDGFTRLTHAAYERGVTFIDTADGYRTHTFIREAIRGLPREKFFIQTKIGGRPEKPMEVFDRIRTELDTDYIDCLLIHCKIHGDWMETHKGLMDFMEEIKQKKLIHAHGVSCHSIPALEKAAVADWVDVNLVRFNPQGVKIDTYNPVYFDECDAGDLPPVLEQMAVMRQNGHGIIGMKMIGEGDFTDPADRQKSIRFAMQPDLVDAVTIGFKSEAEIDEAIENINAALAEQV